MAETSKVAGADAERRKDDATQCLALPSRIFALGWKQNKMKQEESVDGDV